jgi:hypothetical protein
MSASLLDGYTAYASPQAIAADRSAPRSVDPDSITISVTVTVSWTYTWSFTK